MTIESEIRGTVEVAPMASRTRVLAALRRRPVDSTPIVNPTSNVTLELMQLAGVAFPQAHRDPGAMAQLAAAGHTELGFDTAMPVFSIVQEASALGCNIDWGRADEWPTVTEPIWTTADDIVIPGSFMAHPDIRCVLEAIRSLRHQFGDDVAIFGKAMGPWTLCYSTFGLEPFLIMTIDDPSGTERCLARLKEATVTASAPASIWARANATVTSFRRRRGYRRRPCHR